MLVYNYKFEKLKNTHLPHSNWEILPPVISSCYSVNDLESGKLHFFRITAEDSEGKKDFCTATCFLR